MCTTVLTGKNPATPPPPTPIPPHLGSYPRALLISQNFSLLVGHSAFFRSEFASDRHNPVLRIRILDPVPLTPGTTIQMRVGKNPDPGSRIKIPDQISESLLKKIFGSKILFILVKFSVADPDPGSCAFWTLDPGRKNL
jgi:hypothetical protein